MIRLSGLQPTYMPGENIDFEYRVANVDRGSIVAVECSVCWLTEGKGTEDLGVHFSNDSRAIRWPRSIGQSLRKSLARFLFPPFPTKASC